MRDIKFRGVNIVTKKWIYGFGVQFAEITDKLAAIYNNSGHELVIPESIGQFTGLKDKNGRDIFEGDILRNPPKDEWEKKNFVAFEVFFHDNDCADNHIGWQFNRLHFQGSICGYHMMENFLPKYTGRMEIIGNIYENPELVERVNA